MAHRVKFQPSGKSADAPEGASLLDAALSAGEPIYAACGGKGVCGKCRVSLVEGNLSPATEAEHGSLGPGALAEGMRLACQARPGSHVTVLVPEESSGLRIVALGADESRSFPVEPCTSNLYVELEPPSASRPGADAERLLEGLRASYGLDGLGFGLDALRGLHGVLAEGGWKLTAYVRGKREIARVEPGYSSGLYGAAFDVGTTTIAGMLCDLSTGEVLASDARTNPLVVMGDDVLSRVSYAVTHEGGLQSMRGLLTDALNDMLAGMADRSVGAKIAAADLMEAVLVGNTVMHHIMLGLPVGALGVSPFAPALTRPMELDPAEAGLFINPSGSVYAPPLIGGFIGSDITAALSAVWPLEEDKTTLVVDIGTNGELVLCHRGGLSAVSCATGPAFEGAQISSGMRAAPGAIEKALIDPDSWEVSYRVVGTDGWSLPGRYSGASGICGSGTVDLVAQMRRAGVLDAAGGISASAKSDRVKRSGKGEAEFVVAWPDETRTGRPVAVTQSDVRAVQLAKAAVASGIGILMGEAGADRIDRLIVAGAFGNYMDVWSAAALGMFPGCRPEDAVQAGNAAGDGARALLVSRSKRAEAERLAGTVSYLELSTHPDFQERFLSEMALP